MNGNIREHYERHGYALIRNVYSSADLAAITREISTATDAHARELFSKGAITDLHAGAPFDRRLAALYAGRDMGVRMWDEVLSAATLAAFVTHPSLGEVIAEVLGPEAVFSGDFHLRPKLPESTLTSFPWHQDSQYYGAITEHLHIITAWVPLVDTDEQNGCLWIIPGSQRWGLLKGARGADQNIRTFEDVERRGTPVPVPMKRGDALIFSNLTFHASNLNLTKKVRWSMDVRYYARRDEAQMNPNERVAYEHFSQRLAASRRHPLALNVPAKGSI